MRRREFMALLGTAALSPSAARPQQNKLWKIGFLAGGAPPPDVERHHLGGLLQGLHELGHTQGRDFVIEARFADGDFTRFPKLAADLLARKIDLIVLGTPAAIKPVQEVMPSIPIVVGYSTDLVALGFVESLARPGGNLTGLESSLEEMALKQFELLTDVLPGLSRIGILSNPLSPNSRSFQDARASAERSGLSFVQADARTPQAVEGAMQTLADAQVGAVVVVADSVFSRERKQIADLATRHRLPTVFAQREYVEAGGLMSYGDSLRNFLMRSASFVDKIMKGAKPASLPIERPTRYHLAINRKTANVLGVSITPTLLALADEVIE